MSSSVAAGIGDRVTTSGNIIENINIEVGDTDAFYYIRTAGNTWEAEGCAGPLVPYIPESAPGSKAILSIAMTAKTLGANVTLVGICGDWAGNAGYLQIKKLLY